MRRRVFLGLAAAIVFVAAAAVVLALKSGGGHQQASTSPVASRKSAANRTRQAPAVSPSSVTVSVLNGTATSGLAHRTATRLAGVGYKEGTIATASDQTRTATVVAFTPGHRSAALAVASSLKLGQGRVQPIDPSTQAIACPPPSGCTSSVVVTVGSDLAAQ